MRRLAILAAALTLAGCSTVQGVNQHLLEQSEPTIVHDGAGRAWLWLKGIVPMPRMREHDMPKAPAGDATAK